MTAASKSFRYQLPKKTIKADCPQCGPKHRRTLSRYVDTKTGEPLPLPFGRCDREINCSYHLSPYHKNQSGISYAEREQDRIPEIPKAWFRMAAKWKRQGLSRQDCFQRLLKEGVSFDQAEIIEKKLFFEPPLLPLSPPTPNVYTIPHEVVYGSLNHYDRNQFTHLLNRQFGERKANELITQFRLGTSSYWPGACVFWLIDERQRVRAGQVVLFADDWHKAKYKDKEGNSKACISFVSHGLLRRYRKQGQAAPDWLIDYHQNAPRWPILFGLHQLATAPRDRPIAIVEAPKTAVVCSAFVPHYVWLAIGSLSNLTLNTDDGLARLQPLRNRRVMLYPDLGAYSKWSARAEELRAKGFRLDVSDLLERHATDEQRKAGLDLADFLLTAQPSVTTIAEQLARPNSILRPDEPQLERLTAGPCDSYPPEWDDPTPPDTIPTIKSLTFHQWQQRIRPLANSK